MKRACDVCQVSYEAKRAASRYCSPKCRQRAARGKAKGQEIPRVVTIPTPDPTVVEGGLVDATIRRLRDAGVLDSVEGQSAIVLARRIEFGVMESGSAVAALSRELRAVMESALKSSTPAGNLIDELRAQREKRRTSA